MNDRLSDYRRKRDTSRSGEPAGKRKKRKQRAGKQPGFVIQQHDASSMHYDFRLEIDGALASWAVPKGPSTDPSDKRLAIRTEDHPLDYADFEGVIPEGYGAGTVLVWDRGSYRNLLADKDDEDARKDMAAALADGHLEVELHGEKLRGGYALVRTRGSSQKQEQWLLIKMDDDEADARRNPISTQTESVLSGRDIDEVAEEEAPDDDEEDEKEDEKSGKGGGS